MILTDGLPCFTEHAFQRAQERYGMTLLPQDMADILAACLAGDAPVMRHNAVTAIHVVRHRNTRFVVAVRYQKLIITFLPPNGDRADLAPRPKTRDGGRAAARREPYKRAKVRLCDLRRGDFEEAQP